jgi:integrase
VVAGLSDKDKISKRTLDALSVPGQGEARLWDEKLSGFCVRAYAATTRAPAGRKVYAVKYRVNGKQGWFTIGEHGKPWTDDKGVPGDLTADRARDAAEHILGLARRGIDPSAQRRERGKGQKVAELIDVYLKEGPATKPDKRASSWATDKSNLIRHVKPLIGERLVKEVTKTDVAKMLAGVAEGKTAADEKTKKQGRSIVRGGAGVSHRVLTSARAMFAWAIDHDHLAGANPCAGIKLPPRPTVERFLSAKEAGALFSTLDKLVAGKEIQAKHAAIFKLLLLTGARRNEIAALRWAEVDLERGLLVLPPSRTKAGGKSGDRRIPLNSLAEKILRSQKKAKGAVFVFPADKGKSGHTTAANKVWRNKVRPAAKLAGLRLHDLRHSFASFALADGASLPLIGKALGHASARSTERYAHVKDDPLRALSEGIAGRLSPKGSRK